MKHQLDGGIKWSVWLKLFTSPPLRWFGFFLMIILMFGNEACMILQIVGSLIWSSKDEREQRSSFYAYVYLGVICSTLIRCINTCRLYLLYYVTWFDLFSQSNA